MKRAPAKIVALAVIVAAVQAAAVVLCAKCAVLSWRASEVRAAWQPLGVALGERYANVPRLTKGAIAFLGQEDDATRTLSAAYERFAAAGDIEAKVTAAIQIEDALRDLLLEQMREHPEMPSEYDFAVARRAFQVSTQLMRPSMREYNWAVVRFRGYTSLFLNEPLARALGMRYAIFLPSRPKAAPAGTEGKTP